MRKNSKKLLVKQSFENFSFSFSILSAKCKDTDKMYALKQERPANLWEFYISLEISSRIEDSHLVREIQKILIDSFLKSNSRFQLPGFLSIDYALVGHNSSIYISEFCEYGSLFDICNRHKLNTCRNLDEIIAMIFAEQMLLILDHLHASNIIHGDIKPDNFLLMKK